MSDLVSALRIIYSENGPSECGEAADEIERLRARLAQVERDAERKLDALLNHCPDMECGECGRIICKFGDPMHFHHDGCPSCANGWNNET